jgi:hypothetical protein
MRQDIQKYIKGCVMCQKAKPAHGKQQNPLHPLPILKSLWEAISWDMIGPLPESRTYNAIVMIIDMKTKAIKLEPANITISAMGAAIVMIECTKKRVYLSRSTVTEDHSL